VGNEVTYFGYGIPVAGRDWIKSKGDSSLALRMTEGALLAMTGAAFFVTAHYLLIAFIAFRLL
jgi:hypothetical protein